MVFPTRVLGVPPGFFFRKKERIDAPPQGRNGGGNPQEKHFRRSCIVTSQSCEYDTKPNKNESEAAQNQTQKELTEIVHLQKANQGQSY